MKTINPLETWVNGVTRIDWFNFIYYTKHKKLAKTDVEISKYMSEGEHTQKIIVDNYSRFVKEYGDVYITRADFSSYVRIQHLGLWNMFDPNARKATGLSDKKYGAIMSNYEVYMELYKDVYEKIMNS